MAILFVPDDVEKVARRPCPPVVSLLRMLFSCVSCFVVFELSIPPTTRPAAGSATPVLNLNHTSRADDGNHGIPPARLCPLGTLAAHLLANCRQPTTRPVAAIGIVARGPLGGAAAGMMIFGQSNRAKKVLQAATLPSFQVSVHTGGGGTLIMPRFGRQRRVWPFPMREEKVFC